MQQWLAQNGRSILQLTLEHLQLVAIAMGVAVAIGLPVGIWISRHERWQPSVLALANVFQTVPSLALFGLLLPFLGIGAPTAILALVLYALLPIIRNTLTGILGVDPNIREAARAMGLTDKQLLWHVDLPLSLSVILSGVRVATVLCVGVTTIAATIDAGGLGQLIFRGLRLNDSGLILAGAIPSALLALAIDGALGWLGYRLSHQSRPASATLAFPTQFAPLEAPPRRVKTVGATIVVALLVLWGGSWARNYYAPQKFVVGSKDFSESVILAEIYAQALEARGVQVQRRLELAGPLLHDSLISGQIDVYPEYTGTAFTTILGHKPITDVEQVYQQTKDEYADKFDLTVGPPLGFSNDFAILVRQKDAEKFGLKTISDAARYAPTHQAGFGQEFMSRPDGYPGFARAYHLKFARAPREMDLSLTYRALSSGQVDLIAGNATDGLIAKLNLVQLTDDKKYFPPYQAVLIVRNDALKRVPIAAQVLAALKNSITTDEMRALNYAADGEKRAIPTLAREWRTKHQM